VNGAAAGVACAVDIDADGTVDLGMK